MFSFPGGLHTQILLLLQCCLCNKFTKILHNANRKHTWPGLPGPWCSPMIMIISFFLCADSSSWATGVLALFLLVFWLLNGGLFQWHELHLGLVCSTLKYLPFCSLSLGEVPPPGRPVGGCGSFGLCRSLIIMFDLNFFL